MLGTPTLRRNVSAELSKQTDYNVFDSSHVANIINSEAILNTASNIELLVEKKRGRPKNQDQQPKNIEKKDYNLRKRNSNN